MLAELLKKRAAAYDTFKALAEKPTLTETETADYGARKKDVEDIDGQIVRFKEAQALSAETALPVAGQENAHDPIQVRELDPYTNEADAKAMGFGTHKGLRAVACAKLFDAAGKNPQAARALAVDIHGERHSITRAFEAGRRPGSRALVVSVGASGGFAVQPDFAGEIIELLRPKAVVRKAGPRNMPMPRGSMVMPGQNTAATANYGGESTKASSSQPSLNQKTATYKKLTALVPVSNDMMRYSDPAADAFVRDDLVKVMALREDKGFLFDDGTSDTVVGMLACANRWVGENDGTMGAWSTSANSVMAANAADPDNSTGGNFITSNASPTLATVQAELGGAANRLDTANVDEDKRVWFVHPRIRNFLYDLTNSLGEYVFRDELNDGVLRNYPLMTTTQIPTNYYNGNGSATNCSFIFLAEMDEVIILDSMQLELAVSREGTYVDAGGTTVSAFQSDQTIIRAIAEHDFQMRHDQSVAIIQGVTWSPDIL